MARPQAHGIPAGVDPNLCPKYPFCDSIVIPTGNSYGAGAPAAPAAQSYQPAAAPQYNINQAQTIASAQQPTYQAAPAAQYQPAQVSYQPAQSSYQPAPAAAAAPQIQYSTGSASSAATSYSSGPQPYTGPQAGVPKVPGLAAHQAAEAKVLQQQQQGPVSYGR